MKVEAAERRELSDATVLRLPLYLDAVRELADRGVRSISSEELASSAGVSSAMLRKDLSQIGSLGVRGVGYDTGSLVEELVTVLGRDETRPVVIVGMGRLGQALACHGGFDEDGFAVVGLFDQDPGLVGVDLLGLRVQDVEELAPVVSRHGPRVIGVVATPASAAQTVADLLVAAGVGSILNFAPTSLHVPAGTDVRAVDLSSELRLLAYRSRPAATPHPGGSPA